MFYKTSSSIGKLLRIKGALSKARFVFIQVMFKGLMIQL